MIVRLKNEFFSFTFHSSELKPFALFFSWGKLQSENMHFQMEINFVAHFFDLEFEFILILISFE